MASCWRDLLDIGTDVRVVAIDQFKSDPSAPNFDASILGDVPHETISVDTANDGQAIERIVDDFNPDVIALGGWMFSGYSALLRSKRLRETPIILCSDNPYRGDWRQRIGYWKVRSLLKRADRVAVPGARGVKLMRFWNVPQAKIRTGLYGINYEQIAASANDRDISDWPKRFLYIGRMDDRKGVDRLLKGYQKYRDQVSEPWQLRCIGKGTYESQALATEGVVHTQKLPPEAIPAEMAAAGCFVICSRYDCWPLVIAEACSAGLPVIATPECGSTAELLNNGENGLLLNLNSTATDIAAAMNRIHQMSAAKLNEWGHTGQSLAAPFSSSSWADRWQKIITELSS